MENNTRVSKMDVAKAMDDRWMTTKEIAEQFPGVDKHRFEVLLSSNSSEKLGERKLFDKRKNDKLYEYHVTEYGMDQLTNPDAEKPPKVKQIPAGVSGKPTRRTAKKTIWTMEERIAVAKAVAELQEQQPYLSDLQAINIVQAHVLPENRRRNIKAMSSIPWFKSLVKTYKDQLARELQEAQARQAAQVKQLEAEIPKESLAANLSTNELIDELMSRLGVGLKSFVEAAQTFSALADAGQKLAQDSEQLDMEIKTSLQKLPEKPKLPKILVIGINNRFRSNQIEEEFKGKIDLKIFDREITVPRVKSMASSADAIILMTDHISHNFQDSLSAAGFNFQRLTGTYQTLKDKLNTFIPRNVSA